MVEWLPAGDTRPGVRVAVSAVSAADCPPAARHLVHVDLLPLHAAPWRRLYGTCNNSAAFFFVCSPRRS